MSNPQNGGRAPGTNGHKQAINLIIKQLNKMQVKPLFHGSWKQSYRAFDGRFGTNIAAIHQGLSKKWLLLGAHFDHLPELPGANDNAASIGILLDVMNELIKRRLSLSVIFVFFDLEEYPYFLTSSMGSFYFYYHLPKTLRMDNLQGAIILDLCGHDLAVHSRENALFAIGANTSSYISEAIIRSQRALKNLEVYRLVSRRYFHLSDHVIFDRHNMPNLFITGGPSPYYHTKEDTFDKLSLKKISSIATWLTNFTIQLEHLIKWKQNTSIFNEEQEKIEMERFLQASIIENRHIEKTCKLLMTAISSKEKKTLQEIRNEIDGLNKRK